MVPPSSSIVCMWVLLCLAQKIQLVSAVMVVPATAGNGSTNSTLSPAQTNPNSLLELSVGLNFTPSSLEVIRSVIRSVGDGYFMPILSSASFNSTNATESLGFSFGFLATNSGQNFYLAVCAGISGGSDANFIAIYRHEASSDGYVVPVWIANPNKPLLSSDSSLVVFQDDASDATSVDSLRLQDANGTAVWSVSNVAMMEMQNSGDLVIYNSTSSTTPKAHVVWQSSTQPRDTLLQGQRFTTGMELRSNDSSYLARMEKGGLVLYLNSVQFMEHPSPYWVFPIMFRDNNDLKALIHSSPCPDPNDLAFVRLANSSLSLYIESGSCKAHGADSYIQFDSSQEFSYVVRSSGVDQPDDFLNEPFSISWSFLRLENDGRLYAYAVSANPTTGFASTLRYALDAARKQELSDADTDGEDYYELSYVSPVFLWGDQCDVPLSCGPLGMCTPDVADACSCPPSFHPVNASDFSYGCKYHTLLPGCTEGHEHVGTTDFLELKHTATIFMFNGWPFNSTSAVPSVEACKKSCAASCSCNGFFYQADISACYFMTDEVSLLNVTDKNSSLIDISDPRYSLPITEIDARNYITYLKITSRGGKYTTMIAVTTTLSCVVTAFLAIGLASYLFIARKRRCCKMAREEVELQSILPLLPSRFSYRSLHEATEGFSTLLGAGGCGSVYAGLLPGGRRVAVKILEFAAKGQTKQFLAEVATIGRTNHLNVVRLVGFCWEGSHRLLVYEYVENGSLDRWLFGNGPVVAEITAHDAGSSAPAPLDWQTRHDVALGIARGLSYLHEECTPPVLHFDIKPQNILLDDTFVAKLADFGMSRVLQRNDSEVVTGIRGTPGYIAPEWLSHGAVSKKSDVYSMGMVFLEIVGGRRNVDLKLLNINSAVNSEKHDAWYFPSWAAKKCQQGLILDIVDARLHVSGFDLAEARRLIHIALWCIQEDPSMRPYASTVVQWLEGSAPVKRPPFRDHSLSTQQPVTSTYFS